MKTAITFCIGLAPFLVSSQVVDTVGMLGSIDSLITVSQTMAKDRKFSIALQVAEDAQKKALEGLGRDCKIYANCTNQVGLIYLMEGNYFKAEQFIIESKNIREKLFGESHPEYARSLTDLGHLYKKMGRYETSEALLLRAKSIKEKDSEKDPIDFAWCLNELGTLYSEIGRYESAEQYFINSKSLRETYAGKEHSSYTGSLNNLGSLYKTLGRYQESEKYLLEAKNLREKKAGKEDLNYAQYANNLANLYKDVGRYPEAESLLLEAKNIRAKILGKENPDYATTLNSLGILYHETGRYADAALFYIEAKNIREKKLGKESIDYAASLNNLAKLYLDSDSVEVAESIFLESGNIYKKILGDESMQYARTLNNLGNCYMKSGRLKEAEIFYLQAKSIRQKGAWVEHPQYITSLENIANLKWKTKDYSAADSAYQEENIAFRKYISKGIHFLTEKELIAYSSVYNSSTERYFSFSTQIGQYLSVDAGILFNDLLFRKGFLLHAASRINILAIHDSSSTQLNNLLKSYHRRIAAEYVKPFADRQNIPELEEKANAIEKELVRTVAGYGEAIHQPNWQEVQVTLQPGEAAIEFIHYRYYSPNPTDSIIYTALLLRQGDTHPRMIPLFEERQLSRLLPKSYDQDRINDFYKSDTGKSVSQLIWQPLDSLLQGVSTVYASPSGLLHRINLSAIPISNTQIFADQCQLVTLGSTRQLTNSNKTNFTKLHATLFGDIQYDLVNTLTITVPDKDIRGTEIDSTTPTTFEITQPDLPFPYDTTLRAGSSNPWKLLPGTATEIRNISGLLQKSGYTVETHTGIAATEETFKQIGRNEPSPRILHIATHGYFFPDPKEKLSPDFGSEGKQVISGSEHPMIRSGLILAGANEAWTTSHTPTDREDGILTAYEISQQDLSNTELVLLSACETGLGQIEGNEGVYGLQRAFKIAGAKYLIMSLWKVGDQTTSELMTEFYRQYLEMKKTVPEAFQRAQQAMRVKYPGSPFAWAGFVLIE